MGHQAMLEVIRTFAANLRAAGVPVSTAEVLDAARAVEALGVGSATDLRLALSATLVKRQGDGPVFERLFGLSFGEASDEAGPEPTALSELLAGQDLDEALTPLLEDGLARALRLERAAAALDLASMGGFMQQGRFTQALLAAVGFPQAQAGARRLADAVTGEDPVRGGRLRGLLEARLDALVAAARARVAQDWRRRNLEAGAGGLRALADRPLHLLTPQEVQEMRRVVDRLARQLRDRLERRQRMRRRGRLDLHQTLRRSLRTDGVPMEPRFRRRVPERPSLVLLVDVSDSVRNYARFFLQLAHALTRVVRRVRTFVFVSELGEATEVFRQASVQEAAGLAWAGGIIPVFARSDYGWALRTFAREHLGTLDHRTTVFVLGDGRTNYRPPHDEVLLEVRRRARRLVWLCPEDRRSWGYGDSEMPAYARHCHRAEPVRTVADLRRVVDAALT